MVNIEVEALDENVFSVTVSESGSSSSHEVTIGADERALLPEGRAPEDLVEASFRFLVDREPKESIMSRFDLSLIRRYFPEYHQKIGDYL